jgi:hypothetical protein
MTVPVLEIVVVAPDADGRIPALPPLILQRHPDDTLLPSVQSLVRARLGLERPALELFVPDLEPVGHGAVPVLLVLEPGGVGAASATLDPASLPELLRDRAAMWAAEVAGDRPVPSLRPSWARPGWADRIETWLDAQLTYAGRPRIAGPVQQRTWSLSTLWRADTASGAVWLKSCMPRFHAEPSLGRWLSERVPDLVPGVIATDAADRLLLLEEMDGPTVKEAGGEATAPEAPAVLARIARASEDHLGELRALGLADRSLAQVAERFASVLLGPEPVATGGLGQARSREIVEWVTRQAAALDRLSMPATLVHGDFHAGNVAHHRGRLLVFDWSDAVVGHPLMDAAAWLVEAADDREMAGRWDTWVDAWTGRVPAERLRPCLEPVLGVGAAHQMISLDGILRAMEPALRHTLAWSADAYARVLDRLVPRAG